MNLERAFKAFVCGVAFGVWVKEIMDDRRWQHEIVAHGKAEYITTESGQQVWRWKP